MAMRGIESQVMMQRSGEYMRDSAIAHKRGETNIQTAAQATEAEAQQFRKHIEKLQKKEDNALKNDLESQGGWGGAQGEARRHKEEDEEETKAEFIDDGGLNIIDVRI